jgi:Ca2+-binding EF-hand superfamily protein
MNTKKTTAILTCVAALGFRAQAEERKPDFPGRDKPVAPIRQKLMMQRFDKNKDGRLDDIEKAEMKKEHQRILEQFDKDNDGRLDLEERKAFMQERRKKFGPRPGGDAAKGPQKDRPDAPRMNPQRHQQILEKFDANDDGKLDEQERRAAFKKHRERMGRERKGADGGPPSERHKMMLERFDADNDGRLNQQERAKMRSEMQKRLRNRGGKQE